VTDAFDVASTGYDVERIAARALEGEKPELVFVSYTHGFSQRLEGLQRLRAPRVGFVGDSYDFQAGDARRAEKTAFFRRAGFDALVTVYPHTDEMVWQGLGARVPMLHSAWAVDPAVFRPLHRRRSYDIASLGAHTREKYPLRNAVRRHLERQGELKFLRRQRVGTHDGPRFARALNRLRSCFTCASVYGFTVMKYFEIPACETLLFAERTAALPELGFRDGDNFVEVGPADFADKFRYYLREAPAERVAAVGAAGRALILGRHTWDIRARELLAAFRRLV
jgi:hypothetical protein